MRDTTPQQEFFLTKAIIYVFRAKNILHRCCPKKDCNGRVTPVDTLYRCSDCSEFFDNCLYKYLLHVIILVFVFLSLIFKFK